MENGDLGWRPEDFESPIVFVWLTKTKKESLYAVHESTSAVKYHLLPGSARQLLLSGTILGAGKLMGNGQWANVGGWLLMENGACHAVRSP